MGGEGWEKVQRICHAATEAAEQGNTKEPCRLLTVIYGKWATLAESELEFATLTKLRYKGRLGKVPQLAWRPVMVKDQRTKHPCLRAVSCLVARLDTFVSLRRHHPDCEDYQAVCTAILHPSAELVAWSVVRGNLVDGVTVAYPEEVASPEVWVDGGECPTPCSNFTNDSI